LREILCIEGGRRLEGEVTVAGAKNAALPLLFATLLTDQPCTLHNVPDLADISVTLRLLNSLGAKTSFKENTATVCAQEITGVEAPYSLVKALRASFWALGPLLARVGKARVSLPGGDAIGTRPVDLHLKGMAKLGADVKMEHGVVIANAPSGLRGAKIHLDYPSVGATHNLLMCAAAIPGETILSGAAREPEVISLCELLQGMGAEIDGAGTDIIQIKGRKELGGAEVSVLGDRIEAVTYLLSAAVTSGSICVKGIDQKYLDAELELMRQMACDVDLSRDGNICLSTKGKLQPVSFETAPHPGVATDVQPLFLAGLVLLGLVAEGATQVRELYHLDRGYDGLVEKCNSLGAKISRVPSFDFREVVVGC